MERFAGYTFSDWPDEGLVEAVRRFRRTVVTRLEQRTLSSPTLTIELRDGDYSQTGQTGFLHLPDGSTVADPNGVPGSIRFTLDFGTVFALESHDEFYSQPYGRRHWARQGVTQQTLLEVVNEPDPWILQLIEDNPGNGVFPFSGPPVMASAETLARQPHWPTPTGRFYLSDAPIETGIDVLISPAPTNPEERAEAARLIAQREAELRAQPRYRHLFIASDTCMVEVLCDRLPTWEWVDGA